MIANAKLLKQSKKMEANREYAQRLQDTVNDIVANLMAAMAAYSFLPKEPWLNIGIIERERTIF